MEINCETIVTKYLLNMNPLYAFSFPISIIVAIIMFGIGKVYKWSDNTYIVQILIPVLSFLLAMVLIDLIARLMISKEKKIELINLCNLWMHQPSVKNNKFLNKILDMDVISKYNGKIESFSNLEGSPLQSNNISEESIQNITLIEEIKQRNSNISSEKIETSFAEIPNMSPQPLDARPDGNMCIENSNSCNVCSGTPNNIDAPVPGPQWMPQSASFVQNRLKNGDYTKGRC